MLHVFNQEHVYSLNERFILYSMQVLVAQQASPIDPRDRVDVECSHLEEGPDEEARAGPQDRDIVLGPQFPVPGKNPRRLKGTDRNQFIYS